MKTLIKDARCIDPVSNMDRTASVLIDDGQIVSVGSEAVGSDQVIDGRGLTLVPGFIDLFCRLGEPGFDQRGTIASETLAAAAGGYTTVCLSPDCSPVNDSAAVTNLIRGRAAQTAAVQVLPLGALTRQLDGAMLSDLMALADAGCVGFSNARREINSPAILRRCMAYARTFGLRLFLQAENRSLSTGGVVHAGRLASRLGLPGIPRSAEVLAVSELLLLAEDTGVRLHLSLLSCARSVELVRDAKRRGLAVTADVAIANLVLTDDVIAGFDSRFHVQPPLRPEEDRLALCAAVVDGTLDAIVSNHSPLAPAAKQAPFAETEPGMSLFEVVLPLGLALVAQGDLTLAALIRALSAGPASVLGSDAGQISVGRPADLCLFSDAVWTPDYAEIHSLGRNCPWLGTPLTGRVQQTFRAGKPQLNQA